MHDLKRYVKGIGYYIEAVWRFYLVKYLPFLVRKRIKEIIKDRINTCTECVAQKRCVSCGCKTPLMMYSSKNCPNFYYKGKFK